MVPLHLKDKKRVISVCLMRLLFSYIFFSHPDDSEAVCQTMKKPRLAGRGLSVVLL